MDKTHDASASATGYLFQCRYALFVGLKATIDTPQIEISIEKFDDIAFEFGRRAKPINPNQAPYWQERKPDRR